MFDHFTWTVIKCTLIDLQPNHREIKYIISSTISIMYTLINSTVYHSSNAGRLFSKLCIGFKSIYFGRTIVIEKLAILLFIIAGARKISLPSTRNRSRTRRESARYTRQYTLLSNCK